MKGKKCTAYFGTHSFSVCKHSLLVYHLICRSATFAHGSRSEACQPEVELAGGIYEKVGPDQAVVDGNLVTAVAWPGHPQWMRAFLKLLGSRIEP